MGIATFPLGTSGGIKSVQRGLASASGSVTITAVDVNKSFVTCFGTASSGTVAPSGTVGAQSVSLNAQNGNHSGFTMQGAATGGGTTPSMSGGANYTGNASSVSLNAQNGNTGASTLSGGSNNLVAAVVQGYLSNSTTLVVSGACRWEVVEFN